MSASLEFLDKTIEEIGEEQTQKIVGMVLEEAQFAQDYHDLAWPLENVAIGFYEWSPVTDEGLPAAPIIGLSHGYYGFRIMFNMNELDDQTLELVRPTVVHEVTHAAQNQFGWINGEFQGDECQWTLLKYVFGEGTAHWHEQQHLDDYWLTQPRMNPRIANGEVDNVTEIRNLVNEYDTSFSTKTFIDYLLGDSKIQKKGYRVGLTLVDFVLENGLADSDELVTFTVGDVHEAAHLYLEEHGNEAAA